MIDIVNLLEVRQFTDDGSTPTAQAAIETAYSLINKRICLLYFAYVSGSGVALVYRYDNNYGTVLYVDRTNKKICGGAITLDGWQWF